MRLFVAVKTPVNEEAYLGLRRQLPLLQKASWTPAENLHLTLRFLGDVPHTRIPDLAVRLARAVSTESLHAAALFGVGAFPSVKAPKVIWAGISDGAAALMRLAAAVEDAVAAAGFPPADHPFHPHVTLARLGKARPPAGWLPKELEKKVFGKCLVNNVHLMSSRLTPRGAVYATEAVFPFGAAALGDQNEKI